MEDADWLIVRIKLWQKGSFYLIGECSSFAPFAPTLARQLQFLPSPALRYEKYWGDLDTSDMTYQSNP